MRLMTLLDEFLQKANEFPGKKDVMDFILSFAIS